MSSIRDALAWLDSPAGDPIAASLVLLAIAVLVALWGRS